MTPDLSGLRDTAAAALKERLLVQHRSWFKRLSLARRDHESEYAAECIAEGLARSVLAALTPVLAAEIAQAEQRGRREGIEAAAKVTVAPWDWMPPTHGYDQESYDGGVRATRAAVRALLPADPNPHSTGGAMSDKRNWLGFARQAIEQRPHPPCANCLRPAAVAVPVGPEYGSQRDPERENVWLCPDCVEALLDDLPLFHERFATERTVRRDA